MKWIDVNGELREAEDSQERTLKTLYGTAFSRLLLKAAVRPWLSKLSGIVLSTKFSALFSKGFAKKNGIDLSEYEKVRYHSFNDFFTRKVLPEKRPIDQNDHVLISPCDGKVSAFHLTDRSTFLVKGTRYDVELLTGGHQKNEDYQDGVCLILRLAVDNYHRYHYFDNGRKEEDIFLPGVLHTVHPVVNDYEPVYRINQRSLSILYTEHFGTVSEIEVGALMVGKIINHPVTSFTRGQEKGMFEFGGSTIVLLFQKDAVRIDEHFFEATRKGYESEIKMGMRLGETNLF